MSILENLLAAITELNETIKATTGLAPTTGTSAKTDTKSAAKTDTKAAAKEEKPKGPTREEVVAIMGEVKDKFDVPTAKALVKKYGKADKLVDAADSTLAAIFKAATEKLAEEPAPADENEDV